MTFVTCGNCGERVAVTALLEHGFTCQRAALAKAAARKSLPNLSKGE